MELNDVQDDLMQEQIDLAKQEFGWFFQKEFFANRPSDSDTTTKIEEQQQQPSSDSNGTENDNDDDDACEEENTVAGKGLHQCHDCSKWLPKTAFAHKQLRKKQKHRMKCKTCIQSNKRPRLQSDSAAVIYKNNKDRFLS